MPKIPEGLKQEQRYQLFNESCFETFKRIKDKSIDMVMCDPPYGTTQCKWDSIIPLEPMWKELKRITKSTSPIILMSAQPFTSILICSQIQDFKYAWVWDKVNRVTGFLDAKKKPLKCTEDVCVFYLKPPLYHPQFSVGTPYKLNRATSKTQNYGKQTKTEINNEGKRYPKTLLPIESNIGKKFHPTQKPVALMEYLIKTYTNENDLVLDFAMGSGTTGVACGNLNRRFIGCDNDTEHGYFEIAEKRIQEAYRKGS